MELFIDIYPGVFIFRCGNRSGSEPTRPEGRPRRTRTEVLGTVRGLFPDATAHITDHTRAPHAPKIVMKNAPDGGSVIGFYRADGTKLFCWQTGDDPFTLLNLLGRAAGFTASYGGEMSQAEYERDWV